MVGLGRVELPTRSLGNCCSIHLSYSPTLKDYYVSSPIENPQHCNGRPLANLFRNFHNEKLRGETVIVILMGVTGSGKTTVGELLAARLGWEFADADSFHPAANVEKMSRGIPLDDADRAPWLAALHAKIIEWTAQRRNVVLACSALKRSYRQELLIGPEVKLVYLKGSYEADRSPVARAPRPFCRRTNTGGPVRGFGGAGRRDCGERGCHAGGNCGGDL